MIDALKSAFTSKKFLATIIGALLAAAGSALGLDEGTITKMSGMVIAYVIGQGVADHGKEAALVTAATNGKSPAEAAAALEDLK